MIAPVWSPDPFILLKALQAMAVCTERLVVSGLIVCAVAVNMVDIKLTWMTTKSAALTIWLLVDEALGPPVWQSAYSSYPTGYASAFLDLPEFI